MIHLRMRVAMLAMAAMVAVANPWAFGSDEKGDDEALQGSWAPSSAELATQKFPDAIVKGMKLVIDHGKYAVTVKGEGTDKGTVKFDASAKVKTLDITGTEGPNKDKTILAIYELNGDTLTICYDLERKARPTEFKTKEKTKLFLVTYQRKKE